MDSLEIDMELLRRIGEIRRAFGTFEERGRNGADELRRAVGDALERAAGTSPEAEEVLSHLRDATAESSWEPPGHASGFAAAGLGALDALEQRLFAPEDPEAKQSLNRAVSDVLEAAGLSPAVDAPNATEGPGDEVEAANAVLDELAAFLVQMDPEDRRQTALLEERTREAHAQDGLPDSVRSVLDEALDILTPITTAKRVRRTVRKEAVERVGVAIEAAILTLEEMTEDTLGSDPVQDALSPVSDEAEPDGLDPEPLGDEHSDAESKPVAPLEVERNEEPAGVRTTPLPETADPDLLADFVTEGLEYLDQAEEALLALENAPDDAESVNVVFRAFHTIKGVAGFLELGLVTDLAHHAESVFSEVRDGSLVYSGSVADLALRASDVLKALLGNVARAMENDEPVEVPAGYAPLLEVLTDADLMRRLASGAPAPAAARSEPSGVAPAREEERPERSRTTAPSPSSAGEASVRVRTDRLDRLVDMVGELVIAHTMLAQDRVILSDRGELAKKVAHAAKILRELQDLSTSLRMVPLKPAFRKVSRVVRDLSRKSGKPVRFLSDGEDTEIDRTMVDVIADPLVHMVRNSVDHGIEPPDEREQAGKPREGTVRILAYQAGGTVVLEISDDGRGLDRDKIAAKARERGLLDTDRGLTDREVFDLIFAPGFSTADEVTEVSGRGVGMDVVRRNVESLRGRITVESEPGVGSTFRVQLPLTLAITEGMLTRVGDERYIIPSVKIQRSLRPQPEALSTVNGRAEMLLHQDDLIPIVRLHRLFDIENAVEEPTEALLVIIGDGAHRAALLVDELVAQQQFVVKALGGIVANTKGVAGGAILGNGEVGLILDPEGLIAMARGDSRAAA